MGLIGGIVLFARGLVAYRRDRLISAVATSSLDGLAAGEVRVSGVVEAIDQQLTSPLQSRPCVWYRARIESTDDSRRVLFDEERAVHFRITDGAGPGPGRPRRRTLGDRRRLRRVDEPHGRGAAGPGAAPRRRLRDGRSRRPGAHDRSPAPGRHRRPADRQPAVADGPRRGRRGWRQPPRAAWRARADAATARRAWRSARPSPILGQALPWSDVREQLEATVGGSNVERDMAEDIADARAAGELAATPEEAWGNAAIPGFGIGRPTRPPELDPERRAAGRRPTLPSRRRPSSATTSRTTSSCWRARQAVRWPSTGALRRPPRGSTTPPSCSASWAPSCRCAARWPSVAVLTGSL